MIYNLININMKKIYGFAALCAALALTSCSNNDEPANVGNGGSGKTGATYFAVNLAAPIDTRAAAGVTDPKEYDVHNVKFVLFDENQFVITTFTPSETLSWENQSNTENVNATSSTVVTIDQETYSMPAYVMTLINVPSTLTFTDQTKKIADVRKEVINYNSIKVGKTEYLTMTNSAYNASETIDNVATPYVAYATSVRGHVYDNSDDAEDDAVNIYVERVAARVDVTKGGDFTTKFEGANGVGDDGDVTFEVTLDGVGFMFDPTQVNLVKNIDGLTTASAFNGWDESTPNFRTHWAVKPTAQTTTNYLPLHYVPLTNEKAWDTSWSSNTANFYINENVFGEKPTYVVVKGKISIKDQTGDVPVYLLYYNGKYYTETGAKKQLATILSNNGGYKYISYAGDGKVQASRSIKDTDIELVKKEGQNYGYVKFNSLTTTIDGKTCDLYKGAEKQTLPNGATEFVVEGDNYKNYFYAEGNTYYYKEIAPEVATYVTKVGVVRNHLYNITFTSIEGMGTPLYDPSVELIPFKPVTNTGDNTFNFGATINILNWKAYSQGIEFGK